FAAVGFASVVPMIPGVFLLRAASGLVQLADGSPTTLELISATASHGLTAILIILGMSLGLIVPKMAILPVVCDQNMEARKPILNPRLAASSRGLWRRCGRR